MSGTQQCKGTTTSGERCKLRAGASGFCHLHDPARIAEREAAQKAAEEARRKGWAKGERLREVLDVVKSTCDAKGWGSYLESTDKRNWRYATVSVSRHVFTEEVSGILDVTMNDGVKVSLSNTSFHGYGLNGLRDAVMVNLRELPWLESRKKDNTKPTCKGI